MLKCNYIKFRTDLFKYTSIVHVCTSQFMTAQSKISIDENGTKEVVYMIVVVKIIFRSVTTKKNML